MMSDRLNNQAEFEFQQVWLEYDTDCRMQPLINGTEKIMIRKSADNYQPFVASNPSTTQPVKKNSKIVYLKSKIKKILKRA